MNARLRYFSTKMNLESRIDNAKRSGVLDIRGLNLSSFPHALPENLIEFNCSNNRFRTLPDLPNSLKRLNCSNNELQTLPLLPRSLVFLDCSKNYLETLPIMKDLHSLTHFVCSENMIGALPDMPVSLKCLSCHTNQLSQLPNLPDSLILLWAQMNPHMDPSFQQIVYSDDPIHAWKAYSAEKKQRMEHARYLFAIVHILGRMKHNRLSDDILNIIGSQFSCCNEPLSTQIDTFKQQVSTSVRT